MRDSKSFLGIRVKRSIRHNSYLSYTYAQISHTCKSRFIHICIVKMDVDMTNSELTEQLSVNASFPISSLLGQIKEFQNFEIHSSIFSFLGQMFYYVSNKLNT